MFEKINCRSGKRKGGGRVVLGKIRLIGRAQGGFCTQGIFTWGVVWVTQHGCLSDSNCILKDSGV